MQHLDPLNLELNSRHLIEASAGTGKTFNITLLYARLILEKKLSVQEILVMTYTRAATEEIKGRVAAFLLDIHNEWHTENPSDFTKTLIDRVGKEEGNALLTSALLSLDEASIFTIHGFCQRVLKQFAVSLNADLELELVTDSTELMMQSVQDYLRVATKDEEVFSLLASKNWHTPDAFFSEFRSAISSDLTLIRVTKAQVEMDESANLARQILLQTDLIQQIFEELKNSQRLLFEAAVVGHKDEEKRTQEWHVLITWLKTVLEFSNHKKLSDDDNTDILALLTTPKEVGDFINGNRFRSVPEANEVLEPLKLFRADLKKWVDQSNKQLEKNAQLTEVLGVVKEGIYDIRKRVEVAKKKAHVVLFDDLISVFSNALKGQSTNLIDSIRKQFPVALVDEFQDTDRHQYQILDLLYPKADKNSLLLMIGDPKQAIYGFRGGDIFVYLAAKGDADYIWLMDTNWRSSAQMVSAYNRLFWGHTLQKTEPREVFGFDINYEIIKSTTSSKAAKTPLFDPLETRSAMTYMLASDGIESSDSESKEEPGSRPDGKRKKSELEKQVLDWSAREIMRLLSDAKIGSEKVVPADIAILVKDRTEASLVKNSLDAVGLTSVYLSDKTPLFSTPQAIELYRVLDAILHSTNRSTLVAGANSSLLNSSLLKSLAANDQANSTISTHEQQRVMAELHNDLMHPSWDELVVSCFDYKDKWFEHGIFSLLLILIKENYAPQDSAERSLTNMMHLAEAMAKNAVLNKLPEQQLAWLSHQIFDHVADEEMQLRLESDANLIKIVTQHGAKGLEYPLVFVPFGNKYKDPRKRKSSTIVHFKFQDLESAQSIYQLGATHASLNEYAKQDHAEKIRLMYVAVTRAEHRCYMGLVNDLSNSDSALNTALGIPTEILNDCKSKEHPHTGLAAWLDEYVFEKQFSTTPDKTADTNTTLDDITFDKNRQSNSNAVNVDIFPTASTMYPTKSIPIIPAYVSPNVTHRAAWIISSFSNLSRFQRSDSAGNYDVSSPNQISLHAIETSSEHRTINIDSTAEQQSTISADPQLAMRPKDSNTIRFQLEKGADTGNLLHDILELVDFHSPDWEDASIAALSKYKALEENQVSDLFEWLSSCLKTPLIDDFCLADLNMQQTLREAEFYFPMPSLKVKYIAKVLQQYRQHLQQERGFSALSISMADIPELSGMMHGFIDLIFEHDGKYYVADYKSTHLGDSYADYHSEKLNENNQHHLYDLQYLLYSLALHKYLQQQVVNYSFETHFGGVFYLYLRGMSAEETQDGQSKGVFFDKVDKNYLELLDNLFNASQAEV